MQVHRTRKAGRNKVLWVRGHRGGGWTRADGLWSGWYFYNNKNQFLDNTLKRFCIDKIQKFLDKNDIAIGDSALVVNRLADNASDKYLNIITPLPLLDTLKRIPNCQAVISTGEKAAQIIAKQTNTIIPSIGSFTQASIHGKEIKI